LAEHAAHSTAHEKARHEGRAGLRRRPRGRVLWQFKLARSRCEPPGASEPTTAPNYCAVETPVGLARSLPGFIKRTRYASWNRAIACPYTPAYTYSVPQKCRVDRPIAQAKVW